MLRTTLTAAVAILTVSGCARSGEMVGFPGRSSDVVVVDDDDRGSSGARSLNVPKGHYPPPGECRLWYPRRPPGQQPPPSKCDRLMGSVPAGAFILYNDKAWDTDYDWVRHSQRNRGQVPNTIVRLIESRKKR